MRTPTLHVVTDEDLKPAASKAETVSQRVRRLQGEAKQAAKDHVQALSGALVKVEELAAEIAGGGDAYPPGVRDVARRLVEDMDARVQTIEAIMNRS